MDNLTEEFTTNLDVRSTESLDKRLLFLMDKAAKKVKEVAPIIDYVHQKVADYRKQRPYDTVTVVGSVGNELYVPEVMPDGSYLIEVDVLYNREMPNAIIPMYMPPDDVLYTREKPSVVMPTEKPPVITVKIDFMNDENKIVTLPIGACLVEVTGNIDGVEKGQRWKFFKELWNGKTYLKSLGYTCLIPRQEDPSILGEIEIEPLEKAKILQLYRTCRTEMDTILVDGRELKFRILVDKVSALKGPWPNMLSDFQSRARKWPETKIVESIVKDGCLLTHKPSLQVYPLQWKITFSLAEQQLTKTFSFHQKYLFILLKQVKKKYLDMGLMENGVPIVGLTSYHLKTIYLWMCEATDPQQFIQHPGICYLVFLKNLKNCIEFYDCPHFFISTLNVMEGLQRYKRPPTEVEIEGWTHKRKMLQDITLRQISILMQKPENFLTDDILDEIDETHLHLLQRTIGDEQ
ncbi:uncharacterized protein LOC134687705 [Mytilus trossulus]|uniref:uncharacterized protein LOC134687705 n=1 Tax=Mytilus trossulus TaxID=6551 RepID=UPI003005426F